MKYFRYLLLFRHSMCSRECIKAPFSSSSMRETSQELSDFCYKFPYDAKDQFKILETLNKSSADELARFDISKTRIERIKKHCTKNGPFFTINQVLEVEGIGIKILQRLCDSIVLSQSQTQRNGGEHQQSVFFKKRNKSKKKIPLIIPHMSSVIKESLKTVVGLHIAGSTISWAALTREGQLLHWDQMYLNFGLKKQHMTYIYELALTLKSQLPDGDVYVMEDLLSSYSTQYNVCNLQYWQLQIMLFALLNASKNSSHPKVKGDSNEPGHWMFFLRPHLAAHLFGRVIGSERVSAQSVVAKILDQMLQQINDDQYTPVTVDSDLKLSYMARGSVERELMCEVLLLTMTFMDVVIHAKPETLQLINCT